MYRLGLLLIVGSLLASILVLSYHRPALKPPQVLATTAAPSVIQSIPRKDVTLPKTPSPKPSTQPVVSIPAQSGRSVHVPILTYHYIGNNPNLADKLRNNLSVTPDKFEEQMSYLSSHGFTPISLNTLYAGLFGKATLPAKPIVLTFDDGYIDFYYNGFPILRKYNFHAVSFIPTGLMDKSYYLRWNQIKEMDQSGLISFEAHSVNHLNLILLSADKLRYQVVQSKKDLEAQLGHPVNSFAYPYGASNALVWRVVKEAGFVGAVGSWYGTTESEGNIFDMPRVKIGGEFDLKTFSSRI